MLPANHHELLADRVTLARHVNSIFSEKHKNRRLNSVDWNCLATFPLQDVQEAGLDSLRHFPTSFLLATHIFPA